MWQIYGVKHYSMATEPNKAPIMSNPAARQVSNESHIYPGNSSFSGGEHFHPEGLIKSGSNLWNFKVWVQNLRNIYRNYLSALL